MKRLIALLIALLLVLVLPVAAEPRPIAPGVTHEQWADPAGPWVIDAVRITRPAERTELRPTLGRGRVLGNATLVEQLPPATDSERPIAAVNADFFVMTGEDAGTCLGAHIANGELVRSGAGGPAVALGPQGEIACAEIGFSGTVRTADGASLGLSSVNGPIPEQGLVLYTPTYAPTAKPSAGNSAVVRPAETPLRPWHELEAHVAEVVEGAAPLAEGTLVLAGHGEGQAFIDRLAVGDAITISLRSPGLPEWATDAVSGGPWLVRDGRIVVEDQVRHPRTAIGASDSEILLVTVDGRQPGWSMGMSLTELAQLMLDLGCTQAVNLDGGGSTTMWVRGTVSNRPSDGGLRRIADGLALVLKGPIGPPAHLAVSP